MVNHKEGTALYFTVKEKIQDKIQKGIYKIGCKLPTESDLCDEFKVSRTTIRSALQKLEFEGKIYKLQGKGSFVSTPKINEQITSSIKSFSEQMKNAGLNFYSNVLDIELIPASALIAHELNIEENEPVIELVRLRFANDKPYQHSTSYIPWKIAPNLINDDCSHSLFELLTKKYNISMHKSIESIEPVIPEKLIGDILNIPYNTPSFLLTSHTYSTDNNIVEYSITIVRGDVGKFEAERYYDVDESVTVF